MKKIIITILAILTQLSFANDSLDRAEKLVEVSIDLKLGDQRRAELESKLAPIKDQYSETQFDYIVEETFKLIERVVTGPELKREMAKVYRSYFTEQEIEQLIAVFELPVHEKWLAFKDELDQKNDSIIEGLIDNEMTSAIDKIFSEAETK